MNAEERGAVPGNVPYWGANSIQDYVQDSLFNEELVLLGEDGAPFFDPLRDVAFRVTGPIWPNNHVHVLQPKKHVDARYMAYALNSYVDYSLYVGGATRDKLTQGAMDTIGLPCPEKSIQTAIADYLDAKTASIDALIAKKELLIEELRKYQEAVIAEAVAPRDGWRQKKIKHLVSALPKSGHPAAYADEDGEVTFYVSGQQVKRCIGADWTDTSAIVLATGGLPAIHFAEGSFSYSSDCWALQSVVDVDAAFLWFLILSKKHSIGEEGFRGAGIKHLDKDWLLELSVAVPPRCDQVAIATELKEMLYGTKATGSNAEAIIVELKALRAALIAEAVTGKLAV